MNKANWYLCALHHLDVIHLVKVTLVLNCGNKVSKIYYWKGWNRYNLTALFTEELHCVGVGTIGNNQVDVATQAKFAQNCYCAHTFAVERQKAILTEQIFCVVDNCAKIELFVESKCCVGAIGQAKICMVVQYQTVALLVENATILYRVDAVAGVSVAHYCHLFARLVGHFRMENNFATNFAVDTINFELLFVPIM